MRKSSKSIFLCCRKGGTFDTKRWSRKSMRRAGRINFGKRSLNSLWMDLEIFKQHKRCFWKHKVWRNLSDCFLSQNEQSNEFVTSIKIFFIGNNFFTFLFSCACRFQTNNQQRRGKTLNYVMSWEHGHQKISVRIFKSILLMPLCVKEQNVSFGTVSLHHFAALTLSILAPARVIKIKVKFFTSHNVNFLFQKNITEVFNKIFSFSNYIDTR